jgi:putative restriction endonuclease
VAPDPPPRDVTIGSLNDVPDLADYLEIRVDDARRQFRSILERTPASPGGRQVVFTPVETLLCLAAAFVVTHSQFGSGSAPRAPEPVQSLARLFARPPSSILAKMANLDGSRSHGARWDRVAGAILREHPAQFSEIYRVLLSAARAEGIGQARLPDFLALEHGGDLVLLGQQELEVSVVEADLQDKLQRWREEQSTLTERETERLLVGAVRVGQHVFASRVLHNCGHRCVFCGLAPPSFNAPRMLLASHIKPWRESSSRERLDHRNGLAACPTHDVAFDTGLLGVNGGLRIHSASRLTEAIIRDAVARQYFDRPPLRDVLLLPDGADPPSAGYLTWHRERIFAA